MIHTKPPIPVGTGVQMRRDLLDQLMRDLDARAGTVGCFVVDRGKTINLGMVGVGPDTFMAPRITTVGEPMDCHKLDLAHTWSFNDFAVFTRADRSHDMATTYLDAAGIRSTLGTYLGVDGYALGYVSLYRMADAPPFSASEQKLAQSKLPWVLATLQAACLSERPTDIVAGQFVFDPAGALLLASSDDLGPVARDAIGQAVREFVAGERFASSPYGLWRLTMQRMTGAGGESVLVDVHPVALGRIPAILELTPLKRKIASYAGDGETVPEIARRTGRQPETIRAHLRAIYETLGVASRVELAELCKRVWSVDPTTGKARAAG